MSDSSMSGKPVGIRGRVGVAAQKVYPNLDEIAFRRARRRDRERVLAATETLPFSKTNAQAYTSPHVVVVPYEGEAFNEWGPGKGNFYFEVAGNLIDQIGESSVSVFQIEPGTPTHQWHRELLAYLIDTRATHVITHIEADPATQGASWTWDSMFYVMEKYWGGVLLGVMFDSAYRFINFRSRILGRMSPRFMVVDICMPMNNSMKKGRVEVGPVNRPMSLATLQLISERVAITPKVHDISFIGVLYPYRLKIVEQLRAIGIEVAVNPHRTDATLSTEGSRANQPSWLDYMAGLASSRSTINFSQSSAGPFEQLKWRVIEAGLADTFLFTDDKDRTRLFWSPDSYGFFDSFENLPKVAEEWFSSREAMDTARSKFHSRAIDVSQHQFWGDIERGLELRGLPSISKTLLRN